jgi:hypothetical protein
VPLSDAAIEVGIVAQTSTGVAAFPAVAGLVVEAVAAGADADADAALVGAAEGPAFEEEDPQAATPALKVSTASSERARRACPGADVPRCIEPRFIAERVMARTSARRRNA